MYHSFLKILSITTVFDIYIISEMLLEHQISLLEWFPKKHVTLKTI